MLLTSVLVYYLSIANNDKAKTSYEIAAHDEDVKKATEQYKVSATTISGADLDVNIANEGPIPIRASQMVLYCIEGTGCTPTVPIATTTTSSTVNTGTSITQSIGPVASGNTYRIDVISERGNIVSAEPCIVEDNPLICKNQDSGLSDEQEEEVQGKVNEGIIQGTGSIQLDFKSFGAIYPQLGDRAGVSQKGWDVVTASPYGNATGYPGFDVPYGLNVIYVEKFRNLDLAGENLVLHRDTSLLTNIGKEQSQQPDIEFICGVNNKQTTAYNEKTNNVVIPATPVDAKRTEGWKEIYFCSKSPGEALNDYQPTNDFNSFHPMFMVVRGHFNNTLAEYAQTVPYQSSAVSSLEFSTFNACLRDTPFNTNCPSPTSASNDSTLKYTALQTVMKSTTTPVQVALRVNQITTPISVTWIYPDGKSKLLVDEKLLDSTTKSLVFSIPNTNSDGTTPISCSAGHTSEYYTIKVADEYDSQGKRNVYYMTWRMDC